MKKILAVFGLFIAVLGFSQNEHAFVTTAKRDGKDLIGFCNKILGSKSKIKFNSIQNKAIKKLCGKVRAFAKKQINNIGSLANDLTHLAAQYNALAADLRNLNEQLQAFKLQNAQCLVELQGLRNTNSILQNNYKTLFDLIQQLRGTVAEFVDLILKSRNACSEDFDKLVENLKALVSGLREEGEDSNPELGCKHGDINGDGVVDDADLLIVLFNLGSRR